MFSAINYNVCLNRNGYTNMRGERQIVIELYQPGCRCTLNTRLHVSSTDFANGRVQASHDYCQLINKQLRRIVRRLMEIEDEMLDNGLEPSPRTIVEAYRNNLTHSATIREWVESVIMPSARRKVTKQGYLTLCRSIELFRPNLCLHQIDHDTIERWKNWMRDERRLCPNTISIRLKTLRCLVNEAIKRNIIRYDEDPFRRIRIPEIKARHEHLNEQELKALRNVELPTPRLRHVRDAFLFCCYTGLRWSDFRHLTNACLTAPTPPSAGAVIACETEATTLSLRQHKTQQPLVIPLSLLWNGAPLDILRKYNSIEHLANIGDNSRCNHDLRTIATMAGITKHLHWHLARHTCGTLLNQRGLRMQEIQYILGHQRQSTTERHYAETLLPQVNTALLHAFQNSTART